MSKVNSQVLPLVRARVRDILTKTPAFRALAKPYQKSLARDMVKVAAYIAGGGGGATTPRSVVLTSQKGRKSSRGTLTRSGKTRVLILVSEVDFPAFVSDLIGGVFDAIVDASIKQMEAYMELVKSVAKSIDEFMEDNISENSPRDDLTGQSSCGDDDALPIDPAGHRLKLDRQQALATQIMMGINRIVVTKGSIKASVSFNER